jgi:hypothetical protein
MVKPLLCRSICVMTTILGWEVQFHTFLRGPTRKLCDRLHLLQTLVLAQSPSTYRRGGWMGPTASADANITAKMLSLHRIEKPVFQLPSPPYPLVNELPQPTSNKICPIQIHHLCIKYIVNLKTCIFALTILRIQYMGYPATCWLNFKAIFFHHLKQTSPINHISIDAIIKICNTVLQQWIQNWFSISLYPSINLNKRKELP